MMSPIHSNGPNSANSFMIPTSPFRESGIRTSETNTFRKRSMHQSVCAGDYTDDSPKKIKTEI
ncbi:hypothetical protein BD770DRAFT_397259 [Pilaira anomala]|nr:hypothetical protein BD770DRAFT_397259 [Pilaira anomala]